MRRSIPVVPAALAACLLAGLVGSCTKSNKMISPAVLGAGAELNGSLAADGGQYSHTFRTAGTFNYYCTVHPSCPGLSGTVVVIPLGGAIQARALAIAQSGGSAGGPYGGATCAGLSPQMDTVFVGDSVTWTNNSPIAHTVTSH